MIRVNASHEENVHIRIHSLYLISVRLLWSKSIIWSFPFALELFGSATHFTLIFPVIWKLCYQNRLIFGILCAGKILMPSTSLWAIYFLSFGLKMFQYFIGFVLIRLFLPVRNILTHHEWAPNNPVIQRASGIFRAIKKSRSIFNQDFDW